MSYSIDGSVCAHNINGPKHTASTSNHSNGAIPYWRRRAYGNRPNRGSLTNLGLFDQSSYDCGERCLKNQRAGSMVTVCLRLKI